jgi:protein-histidine pros-kinase
MKLRAKFNLIFVGVVALGIAVSGVIARNLLQDTAREEVMNNARLLMESALAVRAYQRPDHQAA